MVSSNDDELMLLSGIKEKWRPSHRRFKHLRGKRRRLLPIQITVYTFAILFAYVFYGNALDDSLSSSNSVADDPDPIGYVGRQLLASSPDKTVLKCGVNVTVKGRSDNYPNDFFSEEQKKDGWIVLHFIGVIYMFFALAIVCDDYFVSSLEFICEFMHLSDDVAGATFMAAGGSAPELFTSLQGVFIATSDIGFGTIIGSAVFNVLFVIALCAFLAGQKLELEWWPLFRDSTFYCVSICFLVGFVSNNEIEWYEALILFFLYFVYIYIMYQNKKLSAWMINSIRKYRKSKLLKSQANLAAPCAGNQIAPAESPDGSHDHDLRASLGGAHRSSIIEFTAATMHKGEVNKVHLDKEEESEGLSYVNPALVLRPGGSLLRGATSLSRLTNIEKKGTRLSLMTDAGRNMMNRVADAKHDIDLERSSNDLLRSNFNLCEDARSFKSNKSYSEEKESKSNRSLKSIEEKVVETDNDKEQARGGFTRNNDDDDEEPYSPFSIPDQFGERFLWAFTFPLQLIFFVTIPDCRREFWAKWYALTFIMSIIMIMFSTYFMIGVTINIPDPVMGLTILAAGTSIPDAMSSVIVAKQGFGDMAVSSSIGSNVFDILVGLPVPWLIKTGMVSPGEVVKIESDGLFLSVITLFIMVFLVILSIHLNKWILDFKLGLVMMLLYIIFIAEALMLEYNVFTPESCPSIGAVASATASVLPQ